MDQPIGVRPKSLFHLVFVIVSEILISGNLRKVASSRDVDEGVKRALGDHARDEGRHHAFFSLYLRELWAHLSGQERRVVSLAIPGMVGIFFAPEQESVRRELTGYGIDRSQVSDALDAAYEPLVVNTAAAESSARLIEYLADLGALEDPEVVEAFAVASLVKEDPLRKLRTASRKRR
jgi:hypothetical protein